MDCWADVKTPQEHLRALAGEAQRSLLSRSPAETQSASDRLIESHTSCDYDT